MKRDPVCMRKINRNKAHIALEYKGKRYYLCCPFCQSEFEKDPDKYIKTNKTDGEMQIKDSDMWFMKEGFIQNKV